jgi:hypothetical protein
MMKNINIVTCLLALCILGGGCATSELSRRLRYEDNPSREFAKYRQLTVREGEILAGHIVEKISTDKGQYVRIQFPGVLTNATNRILEVVVPSSSDHTHPILQESNLLHPSLRPALGYLAQSHYYIKDELDTRTPFLLQQLKEMDFPYEGIVVIQLGYDYLDISYGQVNSELTKIDWMFISERTKSRLQYERRDKRTISALKAKYLLTVPFDIVTFPIQLAIGIYGYFAGWADC